MCLAAYTIMEPTISAISTHAGIAVSLNRSLSVNIFKTYSAAMQSRQTTANSPLALKNLLSSEISATGISQNSVSFLDVAHLGIPESFDITQLMRIRNITDAKRDTKRKRFSKIKDMSEPNAVHATAMP